MPTDIQDMQIAPSIPLSELAPYSLKAADKQRFLSCALTELTVWHQQHCLAYKKLLAAQWPTWQSSDAVAQTLGAQPYVAVRLFKELQLSSIKQEAIFKTLYSSGTQGLPSRIVLDKDSASLQSKILVKIMQHWIGKARLPMLIIDHPGVIQDRSSFSARGAGIQGLSFMGRDHCYALRDDMSLNLPAIQQWLTQAQDRPVLLFGFTFMVWQYFVEALRKQNMRLKIPNAILLHSGGWKKLQEQAVDNHTFKQTLFDYTAIDRVHNFYGMVEQIGAIFVECEQGHLHCPVYSDILIRRPGDWSLAEFGEPGVIQLLSSLPRSYPGHSILTEDRGRILGEDDCPCGLPGKYFEVIGRLPQAEARGCSDTFVPSQQRTSKQDTSP